MQTVTKRFIGISAVLVIAFGLVSIGLMQQQRASAQSSGGSGLRVSPTRTEVTLEQGEYREITQTIKNVTQNPVAIELLLNDFESDGTTGEPKLFGDSTEVSAYSMREFVLLPEDFSLEPEEEREVTIAINVPENASPGGYFGSVLYRATPPGVGDGQVALIASVGSLVLLEIPGQITESIEVEDVSAYVADAPGSLFLQKPDGVGITIQNRGNSFSKPFGTVSVDDWRGNEVFRYELNEGEIKSNVLPESSRLFLKELFNIETRVVNDESQTIKTSPITTPGRYTITGNLSHGTTGEVFTVTASFWYLPIWLILGLLIALLIIVGAASMFYRRHHRKVARR